MKEVIVRVRRFFLVCMCQLVSCENDERSKFGVGDYDALSNVDGNDRESGEESNLELDVGRDKDFQSRNHLLKSNDFRRDLIEHLTEERLSKREVVVELGEPTINGGDVFRYEFWDPSEIRNAGRRGVIGFVIYFEDGLAVRLGVSSSGG